MVMMMMLQNQSHFTFLRNYRIGMMKKSSSSKIQTLFELCKSTFMPTPIPPSAPAILKISSLLDTIGPVDVGLKQENTDDDRGHGIFGQNRLNGLARWAQPITYVDIYEGDDFTMCMFCFPSSSVIPLHDHPGMSVFSKVLYGSLHVKAYDWVEPACVQKGSEPGSFPVRLAKLAVDKVLTARSEASILYPKNGGNLHCFTAVTPCAVLDILSPPYREDAGRKCTYYRDYPYSRFSNGAAVNDGNDEDYAWLQEVETPDNLYMHHGKYTGPAIQ